MTVRVGSISVSNDFEGANPRAAGTVLALDDGRFAIRPWSEDGDGNYKFCLNVRVANESGEPKSVTFRIEWDDAEHMSYRDYALLGSGDEWRSFKASAEGSSSVAAVTVPPGEWGLALHPAYGLDMSRADRRRAAEAGFAEEIVGRSFEGREIAALSAGGPGAPAVLVVSRFHPYETAGSHCVSGIIEMLSADLAARGPLTSAFRFVLVPMPNPDGVAAGCCKRSRQGGPDLCHEGADSSDPAGGALAGLIARTRPRGYLDLHGWMHRDRDGLVHSHAREREAFVAALSGDPLFGKEWKEGFSGDRPLRPSDFCSRAFHDHGAVSFIISPSWFGRTVPQMREFGRKVLARFVEVLRARS